METIKAILIYIYWAQSSCIVVGNPKVIERVSVGQRTETHVIDTMIVRYFSESESQVHYTQQ